MSNEGRKNKPVSFNLRDENDMALLNHAEQINQLTGKPRNFSKYVKKLIEDDMNRGQQSGNGISVDLNEPILQDEDVYSIEVKEAMNSFL